MTAHYDYIIAGAGLSGLSLALELDSFLTTGNKKLLIIDKSFMGYVPRTWSFWENGPGEYDHLLSHQWQQIGIYHGQHSIKKDILPYKYKSISSQAFRDYAFARLKNNPNITFRATTIRSVTQTSGDVVQVRCEEDDFYAPLVFDSRFHPKQLDSYQGIKLWQQFRGWFIETKNPVFTVDTAEIMDFRTPQNHAVRFFYILPVSPTKALVEYTLFTEYLQEAVYFEQSLEKYMEAKAGKGDYTITDTEEGIIPMTAYPFPQQEQNIIPIGTAGGCSKASSGYTFTFVQRQVKEIRQKLEKGEIPDLEHPQKNRFAFYDRVLLRILQRHPEKGAVLFTRLFKKNNAAIVLKFLNNETSFTEEVKLFVTLPIGLFTKMAVIELFKKGKL
jgi:lycopene beta-cyclase